MKACWVTPGEVHTIAAMRERIASDEDFRSWVEDFLDVTLPAEGLRLRLIHPPVEDT